MFKRTTVHRILSGEKTLAELSREYDISPSVIRTWKCFAESGATTAVQAMRTWSPRASDALSSRITVSGSAS
jgi:transposase-like protein